MLAIYKDIKLSRLGLYKKKGSKSWILAINKEGRMVGVGRINESGLQEFCRAIGREIPVDTTIESV